jgi:hypothetical protein
MPTLPSSALRFLCAAVSALALASGLRAAPISIRFRAMTVDLPLPSGTCYFQSATVVKPLTAPKLGISAKTFAQYSGDSTMKLYAPRTKADGTTENLELGSVTFPPGSNVYLVVLTVGTDGKITGLAVSDAPADFPVNNTRFINAAGMPVAVCCNFPPDQKKTIPPNQTLILPNGAAKQGEIRGFVQFNGAWAQSYSTTVMAAPTMRRTAMVVLTNGAQLAENPLLLPKISILSFEEAPLATTPGKPGAKKPAPGN